MSDRVLLLITGAIVAVVAVACLYFGYGGVSTPG